MRRFVTCFAFALSLLQAEVRPLSLTEAVAIALKENPDLMLARLDEQKARNQVRISKDPFIPKVFGGSGLAYTNGYPATINGDPPSIFQAKTQMALFNRPQSYQLATARENSRGASIDLGSKQDDIVYRVAALYFEAERTARNLQTLEQQIGSLERVEQSVQLRVKEGRELPVEGKRAALNLARSRDRVEAATQDVFNAETSLAMALGFNADDRVHTVQRDMSPPVLPKSEAEAVDSALASSKEVRLLESKLQAKNLEIRGYRSARMPQVDLVAQYSLLSKYNFGDLLVKQFQRNNAELGVAVTIPLLVGSAARAYVDQSEADLAKIRIDINRTRNRITVDTRKDFQNVTRAEHSREVSRLALDVAREDLSVALTQMEEGRIQLARVEELRAAESDRWLAFYDAQHLVERARLDLLRQTGMLVAALK